MNKNQNKELLFFIVLPILIGCLIMVFDYYLSKRHKDQVVNTTTVEFDFNGDTLLEIEGDHVVTKYYEHNE